MLDNDESCLFTNTDKTKKLLGAELFYLLENALRSTLNTVKFSSNLTPVQPTTSTPDDKNNSILIPPPNYFSLNWTTFIIHRTLSHTKHENANLIATYRKDNTQKLWLPVYKISPLQHNIFFEQSKKYKTFSKLSPNLKELVIVNIQTRNERAGNCRILDQTLCYFLWKYLIKSESNLIKRIEILSFKALDHAFVLINRSPNSKLDEYLTWDGLIIDPWKGIQTNPAIYHSKKFHSYYEKLRLERPDIIQPGTSNSLDVNLISSLINPNLPSNTKLFNKLDDLISYGKVELVSGKQFCKPKHFAKHSSKFFPVTQQINTILSVNTPKL